jgi:cytochrome oxidase assembly protein ShyY1
MVVCVAIATGLGVWQLDAWHARRADAARDLSAKPPVALDSVMTGDSAFPGRSLGRPVRFDGTWVGGTVYVSGRRHDGHDGYWVVGAVKVAGSDSAMPVVRGWSARTGVPAASGPAAVTGWLQATEGSGKLDDDPGDDVLPEMRIASLVEKYDIDLYSGYVVARTISPSPAPALAAVSAANVPDVSGFTALRNLLYAIEWWVFGAFALLVWARWCRDELNPPADEEEAA